jgi:hypothetical protein
VPTKRARRRRQPAVDSASVASDYIQVVRAWHEARAETMAASGVAVSFHQSPPDRAKPGAWIVAECRGRLSQLTVWSTGEVELVVGGPGQPERQEHHDVHSAEELETLLDKAVATVTEDASGDVVTTRIVRAELRLRPTNEGGRSTPILSGYRSLVRFQNSAVDLGFELELEGENIAPGQSGVGILSFWAGGEQPEVFDSESFELREGARVVGYGTVLERLP